MSKMRLGKGLSALIPVEPEMPGKEDPVTEIDLDSIKINAYQPRRTFDEEKLSELADSIKEHGVVQPVVVRPIGAGAYELVVGERRFRACQKLQLARIPAVIKELSNQQVMEIALIENIQREDLNPVEEANAYRRLMDEFKLTQEQVAQRVAKSRPLVANMVRLLNLPAPVLEKVALGQLTVGQVRPLLALGRAEDQVKLASRIVEQKLTARDAEVLTRQMLEEKAGQLHAKKAKREEKMLPELRDIESRLRSICGTKVKIRQTGQGGRIEIDYYNDDDLDRILGIFETDCSSDHAG